MRKLEKVRAMCKKVRREDEIYFLDVSEFRRKGDWERPVAIPLGARGNKTIGIVVQHAVWDPELEMFVTWDEIFKVPFPNLVEES